MQHLLEKSLLLQVEQVTDIMKNNVVKMEQRHAKLEDLEASRLLMFDYNSLETTESK